MKKMQVELYEPGDHVMVTAGYNRGKVGTVIRHPSVTSQVIYILAGVEYDEDDDDYDGDDYHGGYESTLPKFLKYITKAEYEQTIKEQKILLVPGLPVSIQYRRNQFLIGDNVVTPTNAKKIAEFINEHSKTKRKRA
jgi:ribosomal protein S4E